MTESLLTRLNSLEGPCRECDAEIMLLSGEYKRDKMRPGQFFHKDTPNISSAGRSKYTSSLDAIVGLIERDFPGMLWDRDARIQLVTLYTPEYDADLGGGIFVSRHKIPAIALCIAYVKAKEATRNASEDTQPVTATPPDLVTAIPALIALMNYTQMDEEGVMVLVSRQAIHEVNTAMRTALSAIGEKT